MPRLFVALDLPDQVKQELIRLQPTARSRVRLTKSAQLHVTLHFLGEVNLDPVMAALSTVSVPSFLLKFAGVGQFANRGGPTILWAGVDPSAPLKTLHSEIGTALRSTGYQPDDRPFSPHITLARCGPGTPKSILCDFLQQHADWELPDILMTGFQLYASRLTPYGSIYQRLQSVALRAEAGR